MICPRPNRRASRRDHHADDRADRLTRIAKLTNGRSVAFDRVNDLPEAESARIAAERHVTPLLPPWGWSMLAALFLGAHWFVRRRGGLV